MTQPDRFAGKPRVELDASLAHRIQAARDAVNRWVEELNRLKALAQEQMGDALVATVDDVPVFTWMPKQTYRTSALRHDYPALVEHFMEVKVSHELNMNKFAAAHPEIAEQYQTREFREVT